MLTESNQAFWGSLSHLPLQSEADVEHHFVSPLLNALGYERHDIATKVPVHFVRGTRKGRPNEADYVIYSDQEHSRDTSLMVIEVKRPDKPLQSAKAQAESYAMHLRTPIYLLTNGIKIEVWQLQEAFESTLMFEADVKTLATRRGELERILAKKALLDYCKRLLIKSINTSIGDILPYADRIDSDHRLVPEKDFVARNLLQQHIQPDLTSQTETVASTEILIRYPLGCIVTGPGGIGKTSVLLTVLRESLIQLRRTSSKKLPVYVSLEDVAALRVNLKDYAKDRVSAIVPSLSPDHVFQLYLREHGLILLLDAEDRLDAEYQKRIAAEVRSLTRDYPLLTVYISTRSTADLYSKFDFPVLRLERMSHPETLQIVARELDLEEEEAAQIFGYFSSSLARQCQNPFVLKKVLDAYQRSDEGKFPQSGASAIQEWIEHVCRLNDPVNGKGLERALRQIARACINGPIPLEMARTLLGNSAGQALAKLVEVGVLTIHSRTVSFVDDLVSDFVLAEDILTSTSSASDLTEALESLSSQRFPRETVLFLVEWISNPDQQTTLFQWLSRKDLSTYLESLHLRADMSAYCFCEDGKRWFFSELLDGYEGIRQAYFSSVLFNQPDGHVLGIIGNVDSRFNDVSYALHWTPRDKPLVTIGGTAPQDYIHKGAPFLRPHGFRPDSGRIIAAKGIAELLRDLVVGGLFCSGPTWIRERILGSLVIFDTPIDTDLYILEPEKLLTICEGATLKWGYSHVAKSFISHILKDLTVAAELKWGPVQTWDPDYIVNSKSPGSLTRSEACIYVRQRCERKIALYKEALEGPLRAVTKYIPHAAIWPMRCHIFIQHRPLGDHQSSTSYLKIYEPVETWNDADAKVEIVDSLPTTDFEEKAAETESLLRSLGRPTDYFPGTTYGRVVGSRSSWLTPALDDACLRIDRDIHDLFGEVRSDFDGYAALMEDQQRNK